jgi:hypothetical protein
LTPAPASAQYRGHVAGVDDADLPPHAAPHRCHRRRRPDASRAGAEPGPAAPPRRRQPAQRGADRAPLAPGACTRGAIGSRAPILNYVPGLTDGEGRTLGLFALDIFDDALHAASGLWAAPAAWHSIGGTVVFFRVLGTLNLPHIAIGGFAAFAGFVLARVRASRVAALR